MSAVVSEGLAPATQDEVVPVAAAVSATTLPVVASQRIQINLGRAVEEVRYRAGRVGSLGMIGIALAVGALATLVALALPLRDSISQLREVQSHPQSAGPTSTQALHEMTQVLASFPARSGAPEVMEKILAQATAAGVELPRGQYEFIADREGVAAHYRVSLAIKTGYPQLRDFMDRTLLALPGVGIESLRIERKNVGDDTIEAELKLAIFVKDRAS